jgi:tol-pal system protein YbgF
LYLEAMKMFKISIVAAASALLLAAPAIAQRGAPISKGSTSSDLAGQVQQARQQNAELRIQVGNLNESLSQMTGKVETLEFLLSQTRDQINQMQGDDAEIGKQIAALRRDLASQNTKIQSLQARLSSSSANVSPENITVSGTRTTPSTSARRSVTPAARSSTTSARTSTTSIPSSDTVRTSVPSRSSGATSGPTRIVSTSRGSADATSASRGRVESDATVGDVGSGSLGTISASALPGGAGPLFADAKAKLLRFDYAGAETSFRAFIGEFGDDAQAGEAHYWLGEALFQQKAYADSGAAYTSMIRSYPDDPRAPDALVKLARTMRLIGDTEKACLALDTLPQRYPNVSSVTMDLSVVERTRAGCDSQ